MKTVVTRRTLREAVAILLWGIASLSPPLSYSFGFNTPAFDGVYHGRATQSGVHLGTFTLEVSGTVVTGSYETGGVNTPFSGTINTAGAVSISIDFGGGYTVTVSATISGETVSGSWSDSDGESGSVDGTQATAAFDGGYDGEALVGGVPVGTFHAEIVNGRITGSYTESGTTVSLGGYVDGGGSVKCGITYDDGSITTISATISGDALSGTFSHTSGASGTVTGSKTSGPVSVEETYAVPASHQLHQNYPNPFNPSTVIRYGIPERTHVRLDVFNLLGQKVATLVNEEQEARYHEARFDAHGLAAGMYVYRLATSQHSITRKLLLLK